MCIRSDSDALRRGMQSSENSNRFEILWFFFSSRRRHTRLQGDWSSEVCSSDLTFTSGKLERTGSGGSPWRRKPVIRKGRSEERRVGKECRMGRTKEG